MSLVPEEKEIKAEVFNVWNYFIMHPEDMAIDYDNLTEEIPSKLLPMIAQAIRSKLLINRAAFMEKLPGIIGKFILEKQSARQAGMNTKYAKDLVKKIASEL